jgi:hypothetical protein
VSVGEVLRRSSQGTGLRMLVFFILPAAFNRRDDQKLDVRILCAVPNCGRRARTRGMCKMHYLKQWRLLRRGPGAGCCAPCGDPAVIRDRCVRHQEIGATRQSPSHSIAFSHLISVPDNPCGRDSIEDPSQVVSLTRALGKALRENAELRQRLAQLQRARVMDCERLSARGLALRSGSTAGKRGFSPR